MAVPKLKSRQKNAVLKVNSDLTFLTSVVLAAFMLVFGKCTLVMWMFKAFWRMNDFRIDGGQSEQRRRRGVGSDNAPPS